MTSPVFDVANSGSKYTDLRHPNTFGQDQAKFFQQTVDEHSTMQQMAEQTGGHAFVNTNGLAEAAAKAIDAGSNYYTLSYSPTDIKWDGHFRKIQLKLQQQGYTLAYRRGYYADNPDAPAKPAARPLPTTTATNAPPLDPMRTAMMRGAPDPTQITLKVRVLPIASAPENTLATGNVVNSSSKVHGPYRRYAIDIAADPHAILTTQSPDGTYHASLQFRTYVYDQDGNLLNLTENDTRANLPPAAYARILQHGLPFHQEISVPAKGDFFLRIGVHDLDGDRVGAVEVPVAAVKNLSPLPATATPAAPVSPAVAPN